MERAGKVETGKLVRKKNFPEVASDADLTFN